MSDAVGQIVQYETLEELDPSTHLPIYPQRTAADAPGRGPKMQALLESAADLCQQALHIDPRHGHALQELGWVYAQRGKGGSHGVDGLNEHDREALRYYRAAIANPANSSPCDAHHMIGVLLYKNGDTDGSENAYIAAILAARPEEQPISMVNVGLIHAERKSWASALQWFERALAAYVAREDEDASHKCEMEIAGCFEGLGNFDRALRIMWRLKRDHPRDLQVVAYHAELNRNVGKETGSGARITAALEGYRDVLKLDPENAGAHYNAGQILVQHERDAEQVMEHFEAFISLQTEDNPLALASAYSGMAGALGLLGDTGEGQISALRKSLSHNPNDPGSHCNLGILLNETGADPDEVEPCFSAALRVAKVPTYSSERAITHFHYGELLAKQDKRTEAEAQFRAGVLLQVPASLAECLRTRLAEHLKK